MKAKFRDNDNISLEVDRPVLPTITFAELKKDLLSKDVEGIDKLPEIKFLDIKVTEDLDQDTVMMASFPRSGNTLLRGYLEKIMGLSSGSDTDIRAGLNR